MSDKDIFDDNEEEEEEELDEEAARAEQERADARQKSKEHITHFLQSTPTLVLYGVL